MQFTRSANLIPALVLQPAGLRVGDGVLQSHTSSQQEHKVGVFNLSLCSKWEKVTWAIHLCHKIAWMRTKPCKKKDGWMNNGYKPRDNQQWWTLQEYIAAEEEGEDKLVLLKQRAADIGVQVVGEVIDQELKPPFKDLGLVTDERKTQRGSRQTDRPLYANADYAKFMAHSFSSRIHNVQNRY